MLSGEVVSEPVKHPIRESRTLRYDSLTFWRGVACLLIVVYHSILYLRISGQNILFRILHQFWIGVPIFFVISGYCITASADALRKEPVPVRRFYWRRFRRIFPPYWVWLGIMIILVYWLETFLAPSFFQQVDVPTEMTRWRWLGNITLTETWRTHLTGEPPTILFLGPSWTLCYEEQFYFVTGLILLIARKFLFAAATSISLAVIGGSIFLSGYDNKTHGIFLDLHWLAFASGILAYYALNYVQPKRRDWFCIPLIVGVVFLVIDPHRVTYLDGEWVLALCGIAALYVWKYVNRPWRYLCTALLIGFGLFFADCAYSFRALFPEVNADCAVAFVFAFLIIVLKDFDGFINRSKVLSPIRFCGTMCYSLYLVHWPLVAVIGNTLESLGVTSPAAILLVIVPICVAVTVLVAWFFHRLVERRFWNPRI